MALTLDTSHKSTSGLYHLCLRFSMNSKRYYYKLGEKYTAEEFDVPVLRPLKVSVSPSAENVASTPLGVEITVETEA